MRSRLQVFVHLISFFFSFFFSFPRNELLSAKVFFTNYPLFRTINIILFEFRSPVWTENEWKIFLAIKKIAPFFGLIFISISLISYYHERKNYELRSKKYNKFSLFCFIGFSIIQAVVSIVINSYASEKVVCHDNASRFDKLETLNLCAVESVTLVFSLTGMALSWTCQVIDMYNNLALSLDTSNYWKYQMLMIFLCPTAMVACLQHDEQLGYDGISVACLTNDGLHNSIFYIPIAFIIVIGMCFSTMLMIYSFKLHLKVMPLQIWDMTSIEEKNDTPMNELPAINDQESRNISHSMVKFLRVPVTFIVQMTILYTIPLIFVLCNVIGWSSRQKAFDEWINCVFHHYDFISDNSWTSACGLHVQKRIDPYFFICVLICLYGQSLFSSLLFLPYTITYLYRCFHGIRMVNENGESYWKFASFFNLVRFVHVKTPPDPFHLSPPRLEDLVFLQQHERHCQVHLPLQELPQSLPFNAHGWKVPSNWIRNFSEQNSV
jgi:hypothetical protein